MDFWFSAVSAPLLGLGLVAYRWMLDDADRQRTSVAIAAGIVGTMTYDLFRVPFVAVGGMRLMSAIQSYGLLLLGRGSSSPTTDLVGWAYHFLNGAGFAVAFAFIAVGRHWGWAVVWALLLESVAVFTPYGTIYQLDGNTRAVAIAYLAHIPYGIVVGLVCSNVSGTYEFLRRLARFPALTSVLATLAWLLIWSSTWEPPPDMEGSDALILDGQLVPEFVRADSAGCFTVRSGDDSPAVLSAGSKVFQVAPGAETPLCLAEAGVYRVRVDDVPLSGGFVIIDPG